MQWKPLSADFENDTPYFGAELAPGWLARICEVADQYSMDVMHPRLTQGAWVHVGTLKTKALSSRCFEQIAQGRRPIDVASDPKTAFERLRRTQTAYRDYQHGVVMLGGIFHHKDSK